MAGEAGTIEREHYIITGLPELVPVQQLQFAADIDKFGTEPVLGTLIGSSTLDMAANIASGVNITELGTTLTEKVKLGSIKFAKVAGAMLALLSFSAAKTAYADGRCGDLHDIGPPDGMPVCEFWPQTTVATSPPVETTPPPPPAETTPPPTPNTTSAPKPAPTPVPAPVTTVKPAETTTVAATIAPTTTLTTLAPTTTVRAIETTTTKTLTTNPEQTDAQETDPVTTTTTTAVKAFATKGSSSDGGEVKPEVAMLAVGATTALGLLFAALRRRSHHSGGKAHPAF